MAAFGGTLNPGWSHVPSRKLGNPSPLGLSGFALTTFILSLVNAQARGITNSSIVMSSAFFYGGVVQLFAGILEFFLENTFSGVALSSYGGFWLSYAGLISPSFSILDAYTTQEDLNSAIGFFLTGWTIFTFILLLITLKSTLALFSLFFFLEITFILLTAGAFAANDNCTRAGGVFGIITSFIAWYNAYAGIANKDNSYITVKPLYMPGAVTTPPPAPGTKTD